MIQKARDAGIYTIVSTNAQSLSPDLAKAIVQSGLNRIIVSMDGLTQQTYQSYRRGGSVEQVYEALRLLRYYKNQLKSRMQIELQCLRLKTNEYEWQSMRRQYRSLGADKMTFKTAQFLNFANGNSLMPTHERDSRYTKHSDGLYYNKYHHRSVCRRLFMGCVMDVDGNILPCCFDKHRKYSFGSLNNQPFSECWHSNTAEIYRNRVLTHRQTIAICTNCTE